MSASAQNLRRNIAPRYETGEDNRPIIPPPVTTDLHTRLADPHNYETDTGSHLSLHRTIDFRFPLLAWINAIVFSLQNSAFATDPAASPASLLGYCISLSVALMYFFDSSHLLSPSHVARDIINGDQNFLSFLEDMLDLYVPSFVVPEFLRWQTIFPEIARNLRIVTTLGTSPFLYDFGRQFPSSTFFNLHNIQATISARTDYGSLARYFYTSAVATVNINNVNNVTVTPAMMFGSVIHSAPNNYFYRNWMTQAVDQLLTPNAIRNTFGTVTIRRLPLTVPALADLRRYNPYKYLLSYGQQNDLPLREIFQTLSSWTKVTYPSAQPLRNFVQLGSSPAVSYLSFKTVLPTWHTFASPKYSDLTDTSFNLLDGNIRTPAQFASDIRFCGSRNDVSDTVGGNVFLVAPGRDLENAPRDSVRIDFVKPTQSCTPSDPSSTLLQEFDENTMTTPFARIINSAEVVPSSYGPILTSGILIETNDVSMIGFPTPDVTRPLHSENTRFILGAIRQSQIRDATTSDITPFIVRNVPNDTTTRSPQLMVRGPAHRLMLPRFYQGTVEGTSVATDANSGISRIAKFFPGSFIVDNARRAMDVLNVFSHPLSDTTNFIPKDEIVMWSSFRYYDNETNRYYWLPTLEHLSGTFYKQVTTVHPAVRISTRS